MISLNLPLVHVLLDRLLPQSSRPRCAIHRPTSVTCPIMAVGRKHGDPLKIPTALPAGTNCIKIGLPGKFILSDYLQENRTFRRPFPLLRISFPGRPIFIQLPPAGRRDPPRQQPETKPRSCSSRSQPTPRPSRPLSRHWSTTESSTSRACRARTCQGPIV